MHDTDKALIERLTREASLFASHAGESEDKGPVTYLVADCEFSFDRKRYKAFLGRFGSGDGKRKIPWPFHKLSAVAWLTFRFLPGSDVPIVEPPQVLSCDQHSQTSMLTSLFDALRSSGPSRLVSWGGEVRDFAVLRHLAGVQGIVLPEHLRDGSPNARERLDLCRATTVQSERVGLHEYASGSGIPTKASCPDQVGKRAEAGDMAAVRDHVLADVATTSIIALRYLHCHALIVADQEKSAMAVAEAIRDAFPDSPFLCRDLYPWARDKLRAAGLRGEVFRAPEPV